MNNLDKYDLAILQELQADARLTNAELAQRVGLSAAPCWRRVRALEEAGYIKGYRAEIDRHKIGLGVLAFVRLDADRSTGNLTRAMEEAIRQIPEVVACHYISGAGTFELQVVATDLDGRITSWNAGASRLLGYSAPEMMGRSMASLLPEERQADEKAILEHVGRGHTVTHYETTRLCKDGGTKDISVSVSPLRDALGAVVGALNITETISATSITVMASASTSVPKGSPTRWATTSAWCTEATTAPTRASAHSSGSTAPPLSCAPAASRARAARGTAVDQWCMGALSLLARPAPR